MEIIINKNVEAFLKKKSSNILTLRLVRTGGGWCGSYALPEVGYRVPEVLEHYNLYQIDGISVYVMKNINTYNNKLEFVATKLLFFTTLDVKGINTGLWLALRFVHEVVIRLYLTAFD